eukprot:385960-Prymnesium_polylepis.3
MSILRVAGGTTCSLFVSVRCLLRSCGHVRSVVTGVFSGFVHSAVSLRSESLVFSGFGGFAPSAVSPERSEHGLKH